MSVPKKIARKVLPKKAIKRVEGRYRLGKAKLATARYGAPAKKLKIIAVTGTNGKTTTCAYINEVLKAAGYKTAVYTTAFIEINGIHKPNTTHMTVASAWSVQQFLARAKKTEVDWVVLEVTSHALEQDRLHGLAVEIAVMTNLSQDHLDYHGTMENYALAKLRLLREFSAKKIILNADDEWFDYFKKGSKGDIITVGKNRANYQIKALKLEPAGTTFNLISAAATDVLKTQLVGEFNAYNASMAAAVGHCIGLKAKDVTTGIANVWGVPGRLEAVNAGQSFTVLVDYAHTADALSNVLQAVKKIATGKVRLVFGATGDRDKTKRPIMGKIAAKYADYIYLTDDETYTEDPASIRAAVRKGIELEGGTFIEIGDRKLAIKQAFKDAGKGDVVLLAGIGHQDYRAMGGRKMPWDEREIARELLD